jgi:hypothetical protein
MGFVMIGVMFVVLLVVGYVVEGWMNKSDENEWMWWMSEEWLVRLESSERYEEMMSEFDEMEFRGELKKWVMEIVDEKGGEV